MTSCLLCSFLPLKQTIAKQFSFYFHCKTILILFLNEIPVDRIGKPTYTYKQDFMLLQMYRSNNRTLYNCIGTDLIIELYTTAYTN